MGEKALQAHPKNKLDYNPVPCGMGDMRISLWGKPDSMTLWDWFVGTPSGRSVKSRRKIQDHSPPSSPAATSSHEMTVLFTSLWRWPQPRVPFTATWAPLSGSIRLVRTSLLLPHSSHLYHIWPHAQDHQLWYFWPVALVTWCFMHRRA